MHMVWTYSMHCVHRMEFPPTPLQPTAQGYLSDFWRTSWSSPGTRNTYAITVERFLSNISMSCMVPSCQCIKNFPLNVVFPFHIPQHSWSPFHKYYLHLVPAWISNHMPSEVRDEITFSFLQTQSVHCWNCGMDKDFIPCSDICNYLFWWELSHWGREMHICISSDSGLSPSWCQALSEPMLKYC